jgi:nitrogenase iron protein
MQKIAFYGKGGIGKSTISAGVSMALALQNKRVLHVGCDPKHDSTFSLIKGAKITTVIDQIFSKPSGSLERQHFIMPGKNKIDCIESGGPEAGVGCGGRAVSRMFELFDELNVCDKELYDVTVFDVLGDVVCGGFAAPLRSTFAPKVVICLSEEMAAGYAANNIAKGIKNYLDNGVCLAGVVINQRDNQADLSSVNKFIEAINSKVLAVLPRDPLIQKAEQSGCTVLETERQSRSAKILNDLAEQLLDIDHPSCPAPTPLSLEELRAVYLNR